MSKGISMKLPRKKPTKPRTSRLADESYTGPEPVWDDWQTWPIEKFHKEHHRVSTYYNYHYQPKDLLPKVKEWMVSNGYTKKDIQAINACELWRINITTCGMCCALLRGMPTHHPEWDKHLESLPGVIGGQSDPSEFVRRQLDEVIVIGKEKLKKKGFEVDKQIKLTGGPVLTIQQRLRMSALALTDEIEEFLDNAVMDLEKFDMKKFNPLSILRKQQAKPAHAKIIREYYNPNLKEWEEVLGPKKPDDDWYDQLIEAYSNMSSKEHKKMLDIYREIDNACSMLIQKGKAERKPRKRKAVSADKQVSKIKYLKEYSELGLVSINPVDIVGASELWIYNTKTRKIGKYVAKNIDPTGQQREGSGLSVKGTTITGFSEESVQKTLRKPKEQLATFKSAGKILLRKYLDDIKAVDTKLNGRINDLTILLKVAK